MHILSSVGNPCAINPEPRLRRLAKKRGWRIEDFRGKRGDGRRSIAQLTWAGALWAFLATLRGIKRAVFALFKRSK